MQITLELPEDIAQGLETKWKNLPRVALESLALEAIRTDALTPAQFRRMLGFETSTQLDTFLREHKIHESTVLDFEKNRETVREFRAREARP
jgi:hypothetical protein